MRVCPGAQNGAPIWHAPSCCLCNTQWYLHLQLMVMFQIFTYCTDKYSDTAQKLQPSPSGWLQWFSWCVVYTCSSWKFGQSQQWMRESGNLSCWKPAKVDNSKKWQFQGLNQWDLSKQCGQQPLTTPTNVDMNSAVKQCCLRLARLFVLGQCLLPFSTTLLQQPPKTIQSVWRQRHMFLHYVGIFNH